MMTWKSAIIVAVAMVVVGTLNIRLRWRRSPQAYRAMIWPHGVLLRGSTAAVAIARRMLETRHPTQQQTSP
jgi:hypothetical protein